MVGGEEDDGRFGERRAHLPRELLRCSHVDLVLLHVAVEVEVLPVDEAEHVVELGRSALTVVRGKRRAVLPTDARAVEDDGRCEVGMRASELPTGQHVLVARGDAPLDEAHQLVERGIALELGQDAPVERIEDGARGAGRCRIRRRTPDGRGNITHRRVSHEFSYL